MPVANKKRGSIHTMKTRKSSNSRTLRCESSRSNRLRCRCQQQVEGDEDQHARTGSHPETAAL